MKNVANENPLRDPVPNLDWILLGELGATIYRKLRGCEVIYKKSHPDADWFDHDVTSPAYREEIRDSFKEFEKKIGIRQ